MKPDLNKKSLGGKTWRQRKLTLEKPGQPLDYDCPQAMVEEVSAWLESHAGAPVEGLPSLGREAMGRVMELADGKYRDRTAEMIELVARRTGIYFPHILQRYLEIFLLSTRLAKGCAITASNTRLLALEVQGCRLSDTPSCRDFCLPAFQAAAARAGLEVSVEASRKGQEGPCAFSLSPVSG